MENRVPSRAVIIMERSTARELPAPEDNMRSERITYWLTDADSCEFVTDGRGS